MGSGTTGVPVVRKGPTGRLSSSANVPYRRRDGLRTRGCALTLANSLVSKGKAFISDPVYRLFSLLEAPAPSGKRKKAFSPKMSAKGDVAPGRPPASPLLVEVADVGIVELDADDGGGGDL